MIRTKKDDCYEDSGEGSDGPEILKIQIVIVF